MLPPSHPNLASLLRCLTAAWKDDPRSDSELLARFATCRDESAFVALVGRHGGLVWSICRSACDDVTDAEDAFQATFMALARKAGNLSRRDQIAPWLRITAGYAVDKLKRSAARLARVRRELAERTTETGDEPMWDGDAEIEREIGSLPADLREAFSLYHLDGRTFAQVAESMGCSVATAQRRVISAREHLRHRLEARGVTAAGLFGAIGINAATASPSESLLLRAAASATDFANGNRSTTVAGEVAVQLVSPHSSFRWYASVAAALVLVGTAATLALPSREQPAPAAPVSNPAPDAAPKLDFEPIANLSGRVTDADGRGVPGARVKVLSHLARYGQGGVHDEILAEAIADSEGRYVVPVPPFPTAVDAVRTAKVMASAADGSTHGVHSVRLPPGSTGVRVDVSTAKASTYRGRLLDRGGQPVAGGTVRIVSADGIVLAPGTATAGAAPSLPGWSSTSDAEGRFALKNVPGGGVARVTVEHAAHALQTFRLDGDAAENRLILPPRRFVRGRALDESGKAVAGARLMVFSGTTAEDTVGFNVMADTDGRYEFSAPVGKYIVTRIHPPAGAALIPLERTFEWPTGATEFDLSFAIPAGVPVRGRVLEAETGRPVRFAQVRSQFLGTRLPGETHPLGGCSAIVRTDAEGRFELVVPAERVELLADTGSLDFVTETTGRLVHGNDGIVRVVDSAQARLAIDASGNRPKTDVVLAVRRGKRMPVRFVLPDGEPVPAGAVVCRHFVNGLDLIRPIALPFENGAFEVPGCRVDYSYTLLVVSKGFSHAAVVRLPCAPTDDATTVELQPTGRLDYRLELERGRPAEGVMATLTVALDEEGPTNRPVPPCYTAATYAHIFSAVEDACRPAERKRTDSEGRLRFEGLVPGARHQTWAAHERTLFRTDFKPVSGQTSKVHFDRWGSVAMP